jgi:steroid 5-alpha reductase family enzyme
MDTLVFNTQIFSSIILIIVSIVFIIAQIKKDNSLMDIAYGPIFFVAALTTSLYTGNINYLSNLIIIATAIWSFRLGLRIFLKNHGKEEDIRYAKWRNDWQSKGYLYFLIRTYLQVNLLQGLIIILISLPFIISLSFDVVIDNYFITIGILIFILGLTIETVADFQIDNFIKNKINGTEKANLMIKGLFKYSRRPNYFGETLIWWGLAIIVLPLPYGFLGLISPVTITYIVTKITGPMLEKIFLEKYGEEYSQYMRNTSYFIPLPKRVPKTR